MGAQGIRKPHRHDETITRLERDLARLKRERNVDLWTENLARSQGSACSPAANSKKSAAARRRWADPVIRARIVAGLRLAKARARQGVEVDGDTPAQIRAQGPASLLDGVRRDPMEEALFGAGGA